MALRVLDRRLEDDAARRPLAPGRALRAQGARHVLHAAHGVVDDRAERDHQPRDDERVHRGAREVEHEERRQERERDRDEAITTARHCRRNAASTSAHEHGGR